MVLLKSSIFSYTPWWLFLKRRVMDSLFLILNVLDTHALMYRKSVLGGNLFEIGGFPLIGPIGALNSNRMYLPPRAPPSSPAAASLFAWAICSLKSSASAIAGTSG